MERAFGRYPESNILLTNLDKLHSLGWHYKIELNDGLKLYLISIKHKS
jgi:nucleoside-diphosphate-sugar epimerase